MYLKEIPVSQNLRFATVLNALVSTVFLLSLSVMLLRDGFLDMVICYTSTKSVILVDMLLISPEISGKLKLVTTYHVPVYNFLKLPT